MAMMAMEETRETETIDFDNLTTNTIWRGDKIYHVTTDLKVSALLVIEPGAVVTFDPECCLRVQDGGVVVANGAPDRNILFMTAADYPTLGLTPFNPYRSAIVLEDNASTSCQISFCRITGAEVGIQTKNIRLDSSIHDNEVFLCWTGIQEYGPQLTDILNNQVSGCWGNFWICLDGATPDNVTGGNSIEIFMASITGEQNGDSEIRVQNNTCHNPFLNNIIVHGVDNVTNTGTVKIINNIVSSSFLGYGISLCDGYIRFGVANNGYYNCGWIDPSAVAHDNVTHGPCDIWGPTGEDGTVPEFTPIISPDLPLEYRADVVWWDDFTEYLSYIGLLPTSRQLMFSFLKPNSPFVDAGGDLEFEEINGDTYVSYGPADITQTPSLVGSTTLFNRECDNGTIDLGFHYSNFNLSNAGKSSLAADINDNGSVGQDDVNILMAHLGQMDNATRAEGDLNGDGRVDLYDLLSVRQHSGESGPVNPALAPTLPGDPDNLSGIVSFGFSGGESNACTFVFLDGLCVGEIIGPDNTVKAVDTSRFTNGSHQVKMVSVIGDRIVLSSNVDVVLNNALWCLVAPDNFASGKDYRVLAFYEGDALDIGLVDLADNTVWCDLQAGNSVDVTVPSTALAGQLYRLRFTSTQLSLLEGVAALAGEDSDGTTIPWPGLDRFLILSRWFGRGGMTYPVKSLITIQNPEVCEWQWPAIQAAASALMQFPHGIVLYGKNCNWTNLEYILRNSSAYDIEYWYHVGHTGSSIGTGGYQRSYFFIHKDEKCKERDDQMVFSYLGKDFQARPWWFRPIPILDDGSAGISLLSAHAASLTNFKIVFFDGCNSGAFYADDPVMPNDFAYALGMCGDSELFQVYLGWNGGRPSDRAIGIGLWDACNGFVATFWRSLALRNSVGDALTAARASDLIWGAYYYDRLRVITPGTLNTIFLRD